MPADSIAAELLEQSLDAAFVTRPDGTILYANPAACALFGYTLEEFRTLDRSAVVDPSDPRVSAALAQRRETGRFQGVLTLRRRDGSRFSAAVTSAVYTASGEERTSTFARDLTDQEQREETLRLVNAELSRTVTELRRVQEALQLREELYRDLVEHSGDLICTHDPEGVLTSANQAMLRVTGYRLDELLGRSIREFLVPEARPQFDDYLARIARDGHATGLMRILTRNGEERILEFDNSLRTQGLDRPMVRGLARDATDRIRAQEALRASEERHRLLIERSLQGVYIHADGIVRLANPAMARMHGYAEPGELVGQPYWIVLPPEERERIEQYRQMRLRGEPTPETYEARNVRKDGSAIWVENRATVIPWERGQAVMVTFVDITDRKRAEAERAAASREARMSAQRLRQVFDTALDAIISTDGSGRIVEWSAQAARMFGWTRAEVLGAPILETIVPARDRAGRREEVGTMPPGTTRRVELTAVRREGEEFPAELSVSSVRVGDEVLITAIVRDITDRRAAEAALRASEERLALAVAGADLGVWDWDVRTGEIVVDDRWASMLGYDRSEIDLHVRFWERLVHPEDAPDVMRALQDHLDGRTPFYRTEHRVRTRAGGWKWILDHGRVTARDGQGAPLRAVGIHQDISARKEAELALRKSHDDLDAVLNQLQVAVVVVDERGAIVFLSARCSAIEGLDLAHAPGMAWDTVFPFDDRSRQHIHAVMRLRAEERARLTLRMETAAGRVYHLECDVGDDPRDPAQRILYLYDVTETYRLRARLDLARSGELVGVSTAMLRLFETLQTVAEGPWTVLIEGETGVGKELVARAIHAASPRRSGPFVAVNCAGLTESLLTSQLFGHRKGAFTGAVADQEGLFEAAAGGTIFLDEIGDVPAPMQTALLRVLQEREIMRVGESRPRRVDVRVLAATHRDLARQVADGRFREDLLYRLRVARITVPPLRERPEDIPVLVAAFLAESRLTAGKAVAQVSKEAMRLLQRYSWPGNVRELRHALDYGVIHCRGSVIQPADLPPEIQVEEAGAGQPQPAPAAGPGAEGDADERARILSALQRARGNRTRAAKLLGISRATLYRRLEQLGPISG